VGSRTAVHGAFSAVRQHLARAALTRLEEATMQTTKMRTSVALLAAAAAAGVVIESDGPVRAAVPAGTPVFSDPTTFGNPFFPFVPGGVKVFRGSEDGERITVADVYMPTTRDFAFNGATVTCRLLQETEFENGELVEISYNWFAEADDGSVWYFGETVDDYEDGVVVEHGGSWLVGGPGPSDPPETFAVDKPALYMPANPEAGDVYKPEDVPGGPNETDTVKRVGAKARVPAGSYTGCLEVGELSDGSPETKWWAPGVGVVLAKAKGEVLKLDSSTFRP
jgi:hypothetical protein